MKQEDQTPAINGFDVFNLAKPIMKAVKEAGFTTPSPIQEQVIPFILDGRDVVAQAQTGTGKTAAFGLPAIDLIEQGKASGILVITPTRELAQQVGTELQRFGKNLKFKTATIFGGSSFSKQFEALRGGVQAVVATPGRLLDLLSSKRMQNFVPSIVVLDEADEMLDMGFLEDIQEIFTYLPAERQTLLFSATMPKPIQKLAKDILKNPEFITVTSKDTSNENIDQVGYVVYPEEREPALMRLIQSLEPQKTIIFCRTKMEVDRLTTSLNRNGYAAKCLHGDMEQNQRLKVIGSFRSPESQILVATDVAARGLNVLDVSHVINYEMPSSAENYVHRIGRTARAGRSGVAITLVTPRELGRFRQIAQVNGSKFELKPVPKKEVVREMQVQKLISNLRDLPYDEEANLILASMQNNTDIDAICLGMISLYFKTREISGSDQIGPSLDQIKQGGGRFDKEKRSGGGRFDRPKRGYGKGNFGGKKFAGRSKFKRDSNSSEGGERSFERKPRSADGERSFERKGKSFGGERSFERKPRSADGERSFERKPKSFDGERSFERKPKSFDGERSFERKPKSFSGEKSFERKPKSFDGDKPFERKGKSFDREKSFARSGKSFEKPFKAKKQEI